MKYVIVGNGIAGITAAGELRQRDAEAEIVIVSREYDHFFARTALMYEFAGQLNREGLEPFGRNYYEKMRFQRVSGVAEGIDVGQKALLLKDGEKISYDKLLLAVGSVPVKADWQKEGIEGIGHFVRIQDLEWLKREARESKLKLNRAAVVGGGLIGVEVCEVLLDAGIETHFIIREEWYWPVALNKRESTFVSNHMREHGLNVRLGEEVESVEDDGSRIRGVTLNTGESLEIDFLVVCIGVRPATDWLEGSDIRLSDDRFRGIEVNDYLETSRKDIYAAGDCAVVTWFNGMRRPEQLWYTGRDQGKVAGRNMLGDKVAYKRGVLYNSAKFFDIEYTTAGLVNFPLEGLTEWYQQHPEKPISQRIVVQDGAVIGFNMLGSRWDHRKFVQWIEERRSLDWVLDNLKEAVFDAEFASHFEILPTAETYQIEGSR